MNETFNSFKMFKQNVSTTKRSEETLFGLSS